MTRPGELDPAIIEKPIKCPRCERLERSLDVILDRAHDLENQLDKIHDILTESLAIQGSDGNWNYDPYMMGLYNGMEVIAATIYSRPPVFKEPPEVWVKDMPASDVGPEVAE